MKKIKIIVLIVASFFTVIIALYWLMAKDSITVIYKGEYKNKPIKVKQIAKPGFSSNRITHSVQYGDLKPIYIDAHSTDLRGVPYDDSVFETIKPIYIDTGNKYNNEIFYDSFHTITLLYISKNDFTKKEYLEYEDFFKNDWLRVQNELTNQPYGFSTRIIGVVYGDRKDFIKTFSGTYENKKFNLTIAPDGEVNLSSDENTMFMQNSGFYEKVQMPGRVLLKRHNEVGYSPNYDNFKDKKGKHLNDYFKIEMEKDGLKK